VPTCARGVAGCVRRPGNGAIRDPRDPDDPGVTRIVRACRRRVRIGREIIDRTGVAVRVAAVPVYASWICAVLGGTARCVLKTWGVLKAAAVGAGAPPLAVAGVAATRTGVRAFAAVATACPTGYQGTRGLEALAPVLVAKRGRSLASIAFVWAGMKRSLSLWRPGARAGPDEDRLLETEIMRNRTSEAIVAAVTALSLAATAEPVAAQSRGGPGWQGGGWGWRGAMAPGAPGGPAVAPSASAPYLTDPFWSDSCWQVRPIYSLSGAWLDNQRVNVCH
jgi:hypothetical protein